MTFLSQSNNTFPVGPYNEFFWGGYWAPVPSTSSGVTQLAGESKITARASGYGSTHVSWGKPSVSFDTYALVRNSTGWPNTPTEGQVVFTGGNFFTSFDDAVSTSGTYYYSLFVRLTAATPQWARVGAAMVTVPTNYASGATMFELLPEWYQNLDDQTTQSLIEGNGIPVGQLRRFIELLGFQYDILRTEADSLGDIYSPDKVRADLLQGLSDILGFPYEPNVGYRQLRALMAHWIEILETKGTALGIKLFVESLTGYSADVSRSLNLHIYGPDSNFALVGQTGDWRPDLAGILGVPTGGSNLFGGGTFFIDQTAPAPIEGSTRALRVKGNANAAGIAFTCGLATAVQQTAIPVIELADYRWQWQLWAIAGHTIGANYFPMFLWYDETGAFISEETGDPGDDIASTWNKRGWTATSPAGAAYLIVGMRAPVASTDFYFTNSFVIQGATNFHTIALPGDVDIAVHPNRVNWFPNPSFESATTYVFSVNGATSISTAAHLTGAHCLQLDLVAPDSNGALVVFSRFATNGIVKIPPTSVGDTWSMQFYIKGAQPTQNESSVLIVEITVGALSVINATQTKLGDQAWTLVTVTSPPVTQEMVDAIVAPGDIDVTFTLQTIARDSGGSLLTFSGTYYIDAMITERNNFPLDNSYFDGGSDLTTADYSWSSTVNDSASMFFPNKFVRAARLAALLPDFLPVECSPVISYVLPT